MNIGKSDVTMKNLIISNNDAVGFSGARGGGLRISMDNTLILRQSSFINNVATGYGADIYAERVTTITVVNTVGLDTGIYEDTEYGTPTWKTCTDNLCSESPDTGACSAVDSS